MAEIRRNKHYKQSRLPGHGLGIDDDSMPMHKRKWLDWGWYMWDWNIFYKWRLPNEVLDVLIPTMEIGEAVQRHTNYADNASQVQNADNVLICRYDNKMYVDLLNTAITECFIHVGKMCKYIPIDLEGEELRFSIICKWNYDENTYAVLAHTIEQFIILHIVRSWLNMRNSELLQAKNAEFEMCKERLLQLVNWRAKVERRAVDPLL